MPTSGKDHAFDFLLRTDSRAAIRTISRRFLEAAERDKETAARLTEFLECINNTILVGEEHYERYQRLVPPRLDVRTAPDWMHPILVAAYLRAKAIIATGQFSGVHDFKGSLEKAFKAFDTLEEDFLGELLIQTTKSAREDKLFARSLVEGAAEFNSLVEELYGIDADDSADTIKDKAEAVALRATGGGGGSCTCCTTVAGRTQCEVCSCWIIVIIIIVIVVGK